MGMIGVDKIGEIRRAYFEQDRSIKEIVRTLLVSRATVRKVIRGHKTEFKYARGVQPTPKLGDWVEALTEILGTEANLPKRERRSTQRLFEELRGRGYDGAHDSVHRFVKSWRDERARVPVHAYVPMSFAPAPSPAAVKENAQKRLSLANYRWGDLVSVCVLHAFLATPPACPTPVGGANALILRNPRVPFVDDALTKPRLPQATFRAGRLAMEHEQPGRVGRRLAAIAEPRTAERRRVTLEVLLCGGRR